MKLHIFIRTALFALLCGLLAACQTTGLKPGSIQANYAPSGWTQKTKNGITGYVCNVPKCKSARAVGYGPLRIRGNFEQAIKSGEFSTELFNAVANVYTVASKGREKFRITRKIVRKNYAGFDVSARFSVRTETVWFKGRVIVQDNRASVVFAIAQSQGIANSYFKRYMNNTTIRRLP